MGFVFVILFLISYSITEGSVPSLTNSTVEVKHVSILGVDLTLAAYTLEFDQDLYLFRSGLCSAVDCSNDDTVHIDQNECVCDYTNTTANCGQGYYYNGTGPCNCADTLCDASRSTWVDINVQGLNGSKSVQRSILQGGTHNFRLFVNESCFGFRAYINTEYGSTTLLISNKGIATYSNSFWAHNNDDTKPDFNICPTNGHYIRGTYFLAVKAYSDAKYELVIQSLYVPTPTVAPDTYTCQAYWPPPQSWLAPANCLSDGVPYKTQCPSYFLGSHYFNVTFPNGECSYLHVSLETYGKGLEAGILAGYVDESTIEPPFFNATWSNILGNMVSTIMCPRHQNESWAMIWLGVPCWVSGSDYSNYTIFATTKHSDKWTSERLADITPFEANNALLGIAELTLPKAIGNQGNKVTCTDRTKSCQQLSFALASQYLNPFFPVPPILVNLQGETDLFLSITGNFSLPIPYIPKPNAVSLVVLMAYETSSSVTLLDYEDADDVVIKFLGKVASQQGEAINQNYTATIRSPGCVYSDFVDNVNTINSIIEELSEAESTVELNSIRYKLDSASFQSNYHACQQFVDNLTSAIDSNTTIIESSFACTVAQTDPTWATDPCCNPKVSWGATCYPQNISFSLVDISVQQDSVEKVCKHSQCSQSYLDDYVLAKSSFQGGQCSVQTDVSLEVPAVQKKYRYCKQQALQVDTCYSDSDCFYANQSYSCNIFSRTCMIPHQVQEKYFMECLTTQLTEAQETYLQKKYNITALMEDPEFIDEWYSKIATTDCLANYGSSVSLAHRNRAVIAAANTDCAESTSCPTYECEDTNCLYPELNCFVICQGAVLSYENSAEADCISDVQCNWNATLCENLSEEQCMDACVPNNTTTSFCGLCQNDECVEFSGLSESACASTTVCALHNGTYLFNLTEAQCTGIAECNVPCGYTCQSFIPTFSQGICYSYPADSTACSSSGGVWTINNGTQSNSSLSYVCVFPGETAASCQSISGASFDTCSSLSDYECNQCTQGSCLSLGQNLLRCGLVEQPCQNPTTCGNAGTCTDSDYFVNLNYALYGACEVPRYPPVDGVSDYPFCLPEQYSVPNGCIDWSATSEATCSGTWHFPAETSTQCTAQKGCLDLAGNQLRFSPKSETDCTSEYTQGSWESYYDWTPGRWIGGVQRNLTWTSRQTFTKYQWNTTASFFNLQADFFGSASHILALQSKSAALCQYERTLDPMLSVVCDCTESGSSDCFQTSTSSAIAQLQVCEQTPFSSHYADVMITAYNDSVELFCVDLLLSKISANNFKTHTAERLLANFVPFSELDVPDFAVFNRKNAAIGSLVSDGVVVTPLGEVTINNLELCLKKTITHNFDFPVQDFGVDKGDDIVPLNMADLIYPVVIADNSVNDGTYLCAKINVTTERHYFAIERKANYEDVDEQKLSSVAEIFTYTLAIIFLMASVAVTGQLILYLHSWYAGSLPLILEHFLVFFIWLFVCVRTIYFFLVTTGFDSQIGDYALVALPTFFYFTAFTIIVILWAVVASKRFTNDIEKFKRVINRAVVIINVLLYATFIALILAFQYGTTESSACGSRQDSDNNTNEIRRNVSVAYGLIISITSLIIGVLFIVFGIRIRNFIMANESNERIFIVTAVCSVCFILHCAFILAVSFMNEPNLYFSFFGLLLTEWLPAIFIIGWLFFRRRNVLLSGSSNNTGGGSHVITQKRSKSGSGSRGVEMRHLESSITQDDYRL